MSTIVEASRELPARTRSWRGARWEGRFHALLTAALAAVVVVSLAGWQCAELTLSPRQALPTVLLLVLLLAAAAQYRLRREVKCFQLVMMVFWIVLVTNAHFFPMYMAARRDVPMCDAWLARADAALGIEVPRVMAALAPYPRLNQAMLQIYLTLIPLMTLAAILPAALDRMDKAKEFVIGCIVAAAISLPIFACVQAVGPWQHYQFEPAIASLAGKAAMLARLKTDAPFVIDVTNRDGLITFPSFHVVLTVLAAAALWPFPRLRWPVVAWATLIVLSTVTTGIHYAIDVVGGLLVAAVAWTAARACVRWESAVDGRAQEWTTL